MAPFYRLLTMTITFYWLTIVSITLSHSVFQLFDVMKFRLGITPLESLGTVSYSHFVPTMTVVRRMWLQSC